ncbi:type I polyketide synthase [Antarctobacter sp.]|uniref:type I polyketide synthase n=1 Tax=Antarctobacter sp. TaxID=1872577 RepID=UPI002B2659C1|nr:SDR family NAD(P)-dependent oxidoreductase [Antarctobacter sp.]
MQDSESIAIVGIGCRFPGGAATPGAFWNLLEAGIDATCEVPAERWSIQRFYDPDPATPGKIYTNRGGFLRESIREFDARFFGISPREAAQMDPQQRLLLEVAWEAFEHAGIVPDDMRGSLTGVFVGGFTIDNKIHLLNALNREAITSHTAVSATLGMLSNRLSYIYDLRGPSITTDTACSSSMVALHLAVQALRRGECDTALVGGVNVMFRPAYMVAMSKGGFLSPDGRCKSFDARGDGYGRGEGAGMLVLKPLSAAERDGDTIQAVILETGVNQDGRTDGITLPNVDAQAALVERVLDRAQVSPAEVQYVEAHGTGTRAGDATEAESLSRSIARKRPASAGPLVIGSAKSNIGHLEAAAGVAGVIKAALALKHRKIPPSLHFRTPPDTIDLEAQRIKIPTALQDWPEATRAIAAVNSFGYGGTNAHALLAEPPKQVQTLAPAPDRPMVLPVSARSDASLIRQLKHLHQVIKAHPGTSVPDLCYTAARRRSHHPFRAAVVCDGLDQVQGQLKNFFAGDDSERVFVPPTDNRVSPKLAFVYTGMGPQSWGMAAELIDADPLAAKMFDQCDALWLDLTGQSLKPLFADRSGAPMQEPIAAQPANFVTQVMLTEVLRAYGLTPASVVGHSTGEIAAAWASGTLTLKDALRVTWHRCRLQQTCLGQGRMMAIGQPEGMTRAELPDGLDIAAVNSPRSVTLAGTEAALTDYARQIEAKDGFARLLKVGVAYHSRQMDGIKDDFLSSLASLSQTAPQLPLYSSVTGAQVKSAEQDADYWWRNLRETVRFADAADAMVADGHTIFLEVGPHPVLAGALAEILAAARVKGVCVPSLRRQRPEQVSVASAVAEIYSHGVDLDWQRPCPSGARVHLLSYPWDREDFWSESELSSRDRLGTNEHPILSRSLDQATPTWQGELTRTTHGFLADHCVRGDPVFPAAGYVELALAARRNPAASTVIEDMKFEALLPSFATPMVRLHLDEASGAIQIYARERSVDAKWGLNATGFVRQTSAPPRHEGVDLSAIKARCVTSFDTAAFYQKAKALGLDYGASFRCLRSGHLGENEALFQLRLASTDTPTANDYYAHPVLLDGALQAGLALQFATQPDAGTVSLPTGIGQLRFHKKLDAEVWCHIWQQGSDISLAICDAQGAALLDLSGLRTRALPVATVRGRTQEQVLYTSLWDSPRTTKLPVAKETTWLVFADKAGIAEGLGDRAADNLMTVVTVTPGPAFARLSPTEYQIERNSPDDMQKLLSCLGDQELAGVIYLWPVDIPDIGPDTDQATTGCADVVDLLHLIQALNTQFGAAVPPLTVCCAQSQIVTVGDTGQSAPGQHAVWSAIRAAQLELRQIAFRLVDLPTRNGFIASKRLMHELHLAQADTEVAYRGDYRFANRVVRFGPERYPARTSKTGTRYQFASVNQGGTERRGLIEIAPRALGREDVEVALQWNTIGDFDHRSIQKHGAPNLPPLALRCAGRITALGSGVTDLVVGQPVIVLAPQGRVNSHLVLPAGQVLAYPEEISPDEDRGALLDWMTAHHALFALCDVTPGDWVLIHQAETGVGFAAAQLCLASGAQVIATAGTETRRAALRDAGCHVVSDARTFAFRDAVHAVTGGRGADVALTPLGGEMRVACFDAVRPGGALLDYSPVETSGAQIPLSLLDRGIRYLRADLARVFADDRTLAERALAGVRLLLAEGALRPIPVTTFHPSEIEKALNASVQDGHIGRLALDTGDKIVPLIARPQRQIVHPDAGYLITGGFGGIGVETIRWLVDAGARHIAVLSRSGPKSKAAQAMLQELDARGCTLVHQEIDIGEATSVAQAVKALSSQMPPLRGVIHAAGVLADTDIEQMTADQVQTVMAAKASGALNLHHAFVDAELDFFVCYGSIAASLGNIGQYNYAAANGFLHGLVMARRARGLVGTCINWGPVADSGMVAEDDRIAERLARAGLSPVSMEMVCDVISEAIQHHWVSFDVVDIDWATWGRQASTKDRRRLAKVLPEGPAGGVNSAAGFRDLIYSLDPNERLSTIFAMVVGVTARVLRLNESQIDASANLADLGTDSIMAAEIRQELAARTDVSLRTVYLTRGPELADIARRLELAILRGETVYS